jgi:hypothetical protein
VRVGRLAMRVLFVLTLLLIVTGLVLAIVFGALAQ